MTSPGTNTLEHLLDGVRKGAESYRAQHPEDHVVCSVTLDSDLWKSGVRSLVLADGYVLPIDDEGEGVSFVSMDGSKPDQPLTDNLLWFHPARPDEDEDEDWWGGDEWDEDDDDEV